MEFNVNQLNVDNFMKDSVQPIVREKYVYILQDGSVVKFSAFNPNRGQLHSVGQVMHFMEIDVITHSEEFYQKYSCVDFSKINSTSEKFNELVQRVGKDTPVYQGIVKEVVTLTGVLTPESSPEEILYTFASEQLDAATLAWLFKAVFTLANRHIIIGVDLAKDVAKSIAKEQVKAPNNF